MKPNSSYKPIWKWHYAPDEGVFWYARSFRKAAANVLRTTELPASHLAVYEVGAIVALYRQALELHLKALVFAGGRRLDPRPDRFSLYKTRSLSWLAQIVTQIVTSAGWESEFRCDGIETLRDFRSFLDELNEGGLALSGFRYPTAAGEEHSESQDLARSLARLARQADALMELLDRTADALAAEADLASDPRWSQSGGARSIQ